MQKQGHCTAMVNSAITTARGWKRDIKYRAQNIVPAGDTPTPIPLILPYVKGLHESIQKNSNSLQRLLPPNVKLLIGYRNSITIGQLLGSIHSPPETKPDCSTKTLRKNCLVCNNIAVTSNKELNCGSAGIYKIRCGKCHEAYGGKTTRTFRIRVGEHKNCVTLDLDNADQGVIRAHIQNCYPEANLSKGSNWMNKIEITLVKNVQRTNNRLLSTLAYFEDKTAMEIVNENVGITNKAPIFCFDPKNT